MTTARTDTFRTTSTSSGGKKKVNIWEITFFEEKGRNYENKRRRNRIDGRQGKEREDAPTALYRVFFFFLWSESLNLFPRFLFCFSAVFASQQAETFASFQVPVPIFVGPTSKRRFQHLRRDRVWQKEKLPRYHVAYWTF